MSRDANRLRAGFDAIWQRDDWEAAFGALEPDFEWTPMPNLPDSGTGPHRGRESFERMFREWLDTWEEHHADYEFTDLGNGRVLADVTIRGRGRGSGVEVTQSSAQVWTIRGDRPVRLDWYESRQRALAAVQAQ